MLTKIWWLPIRLGIPLAMFAGLTVCWPIRGELHFLIAYHLFRTAGLLVATPLNRAAILIVPALFLSVLLFRLAGYLHDAARRWTRTVLILLLLAIPFIIAHRYDFDRPVLQALHNIVDVLISDDYRFYTLLGGAGVLVLLAAGWRQGMRAIRWIGNGGARLTQPARMTGRICLRVAHVLGLLLLLGFLGIDLLAGFFALRATQTRRQHPNVIMIMVDTLRADHVGCYGYPRNTTPNIDRFAHDSTLYGKVIAQAPWTLWSVYSFLTSTYSDGVHFDLNMDTAAMRSGPPLLADILRNEGYSTNAVLSNPMFRFFPVFKQGFAYYDTLPTIELQGITSPAVTAATVQRLPSLKGAGPFFLYVVYFDPHAPYYSHPGFSFSDGMPGPRPVQLSPETNHTTQQPARCHAVEDKRDRYDSEIAFTDAEVGKLLVALKAQGLYDDSLIIFLSDHGEEFLEHGYQGHMYTLYNETLSVPLMVKLPGQRTGAVVGGEFPLLDLSPSILGFLQARTPADHALGVNAGFGAIQRCARKPIFSSSVEGVFSVQQGNMKYMSNALTGKQEIYDLSKDPWEQDNLAVVQPQLVAEWRTILSSRNGPPPAISSIHSDRGTDAVTMNKETLERLHSLGYLQR